MSMFRWLVFLYAFLWAPICLGQQFYECKVSGSAPIYQDFPCEKGKERGIEEGGVSSVEKDRYAVEGLVKHGYLERAHQYALDHGMTEAQFQSIADRTNKQTQQAYNQTQREVAARRAQAAREQALKEAAAQAAYVEMMSEPSYVPVPHPASEVGTPAEVVDEPPPAWKPAPPAYDPESNRWCQSTSPDTVHCWQ